VDPKELERFPHRNRCQIAERIELTDEAAVESFYARFDGPSAPRLWASIHIAGGFAMSSVEATSKADFVKLMQTNALTCFLCSREAVKRMKRAAPGPSGGRIVNVAARPGLIPELGSGMVPYTTSKAAVAAMTQAMAAEVADSGILVNAVVPSIMDTRVNREAHAERRSQQVAQSLGRRGHHLFPGFPLEYLHPWWSCTGLRAVVRNGTSDPSNPRVVPATQDSLPSPP
jgi:NAD(P)-dependent dehydrogenase (short-subunit alcohol dehydrogenase family)